MIYICVDIPTSGQLMWELVDWLVADRGITVFYLLYLLYYKWSPIQCGLGEILFDLSYQNDFASGMFESVLL
jgi:hypothetical protein